MISKKKIPKIILEKGPAANTANCFGLDFLFNSFSSGSTKAPKMGPKNKNPEDLILILYKRAQIPWENSCTVATKKIATIQCQKERLGNPGTLTPGKTGATAGGASATKSIVIVPLTNKKRIMAIPIKPMVVPMCPHKFKGTANNAPKKKAKLPMINQSC